MQFDGWCNSSLSPYANNRFYRIDIRTYGCNAAFTLSLLHGLIDGVGRHSVELLYKWRMEIWIFLSFFHCLLVRVFNLELDSIWTELRFKLNEWISRWILSWCSNSICSNKLIFLSHLFSKTFFEFGIYDDHYHIKSYFRFFYYTQLSVQTYFLCEFNIIMNFGHLYSKCGGIT